MPSVPLTRWPMSLQRYSRTIKASSPSGRAGNAVSIVSEPLEQPDTWQALPASEVLVVCPDRTIRFEDLDLGRAAAE